MGANPSEPRGGCRGVSVEPRADATRSRRSRSSRRKGSRRRTTPAKLPCTLRGVDLTLARGEMVAIMGPSGCGKTTLLNCLSGLDSIDSGEVVIEGTPLSAMSDRARTDYRARRMGFVFQFYNLMPVLSAVENVELPLLVSRESRRRTAPGSRSTRHGRARRLGESRSRRAVRRTAPARDDRTRARQ